MKNGMENEDGWFEPMGDPDGEPVKDVEYPRTCPNPECGASNPDNSPVCGSCDMKFKPVSPDDLENINKDE